jgi:uncharacterized protein with NRDE domain
MCLILFAVDAHPEYSLVLAANRDEFYARPSAPAAFWEEAPQVLGGRDLTKGGSWLGVNSKGQWCAVTNYRDGSTIAPSGRSRGSLVSNFLTEKHAPYDYATKLAQAEPMAGYNLILGDESVVCHTSNRGMPATRLSPGIYGLSNHLLNTAWPKVERGRAALASALQGPATQLRDELFDLLQDRTVAADEALPDTGVGASLEKILSAAFIQTPNYGTRCSTVLLIGRDRTVVFEERGFGEADAAFAPRRFEFALELSDSEAASSTGG